VVAIGYLDSGHWASDLAAGSRFGYSLLFILLISNLAACLFQSMAARLGVVTGRDLAEMCRIEFPKWIYWPLYVINELGIFAIELTEVIGSAVAIELLFGVPLPIGICITSLDVFVLLLAYRPQRSLWSVRFIECLAIAMIIGVGACLVALLKHAQPVFSKVASGLLPDSAVMQIEQGRLFVAMALIGATVMPHNLFLHSHAVKARVYESKSSPEIFDNDSLDSKRNSILYCSPVQPSELQKKPKYRTPKNLRRAICYSIIDSSLALTIALLINMSVLILAGTTFYDQSSEIAHSLKGGDSNNSKSIEIVDLYDAHRLIGRQLGKGAATLFAVALLVAGQCGAVISTIAGQSIMEGFIRWRCSPILRRLITRICAMIPAMIIASTAGRDGIMRLLVFSHVVLGIQVPFAIIPLVWFTGKARIMRS
ncbi:NRAMP family, partial [Syncephalis fuscata]